jgi:hypothetical protein
MPEAVALEMIGGFLLDWAGAERFLSAPEGRLSPLLSLS